MEPFMSTYTINGVTLALMQGDIVRVEVDAIVNAANAALAGGGGVDGAIHRAGGPTIMEECRKIGGCSTGSAVATQAGRLKAQYVFHAVGPIYQQRGDEEQLLANAYQSCLDLAERYQIKSIAFPSLSTGCLSLSGYAGCANRATHHCSSPPATHELAAGTLCSLRCENARCLQASHATDTRRFITNNLAGANTGEDSPSRTKNERGQAIAPAILRTIGANTGEDRLSRTKNERGQAFS
jgi:O-acetyl-ADP-ribose deacetylase (regulator of RNase III)